VFKNLDIAFKRHKSFTAYSIAHSKVSNVADYTTYYSSSWLKLNTSTTTDLVAKPPATTMLHQRHDHPLWFWVASPKMLYRLLQLALMEN
jgi:hypothetical protein